MTKVERFECDCTGEVFGSKNAGEGVLEINIRRHGSSEFEYFERTFHVSRKYLRENVEDSVTGVPQKVKYLGVKEGEIVGGILPWKSSRNEDREVYEERGSVMMEDYEEFFELIEEEVLY